MNCEVVQSQLTALLDGELPSEMAAEIGRHLAGCPGCSQKRAELASVKEMASAWDVNVPDIGVRVMRVVAAEEQGTLLAEMRELRTEMEALRTEVTALRWQLSRPETAWTPPGRFEKDYPQMENDPWNLIRS